MDLFDKKKTELFNFAYFHEFDKKISFLAENLADKEVWDFDNPNEKKYSILKNYLEHTFRRLKYEKKIAYTTDNKYACFNTGLVTSNLEDIFAFFETHKNPEKTPYFFKAFYKKSNNELLRFFGNSLPEVANYFEKPEDLIFNPRCELIPDLDHIIQDNMERFPDFLKRQGESEMRMRLQGAIDETKKRVKTNYKIAIPQFYNNRIQLLLPLYLTPNSPNPDLALVTHKIDEKTYTARTCLTLKMAYNNARLIVKPQSDWLKP
ncbi:DUF3825 domain-containing protein [Raineya sp.]|jgi:hypothetical protein